MPSLFGAALSCYVIALLTEPALAQQDTGLEDFSNTTLGKIAIAVVSAALSLIVGYILTISERTSRTYEENFVRRYGFEKGCSA